MPKTAREEHIQVNITFVRKNNENKFNEVFRFKNA